MRYVFALGGNAFGKRNLNIVAKAIVSLHSKGDEIVITHGNGPEVGELYLKEGKNLAILTGETERILGGEIRKGLLRQSRHLKVSMVLTRTLVNAEDPEFNRPTKPIGRFYKDRDSVPLGRRKFVVKRLYGGYRLVVPSPRPVGILEVGKVKRLLRRKEIVIATGGGGMAVTRLGKGIRFADAVIDKDLASSLLARKINAARLFILTNVDGAYTDFGSRKRRMIRKIHAKKMEEYLKDGHFEEGSMKPKVEACIEFVRATHGIAAIGNIAKISDVINMRSTVVLP